MSARPSTPSELTNWTGSAHYRAQERLEALSRQEIALTKNLAATTTEIATIKAWLALHDHYESGAEISPDGSLLAAMRQKASNLPRNVVGAVVEEILREAQRPMLRAELLKAVTERIPINGKNPEAVLGTMLWRMKDRFERMPGKGYQLRGGSA